MVRNNLVDMRHKLQDIQSNKTFLESKIQEYEKKLLDLKGNNGDNQSAGNKAQQHQLSQKISSLSATLLKKVLSGSQK